VRTFVCMWVDVCERACLCMPVCVFVYACVCGWMCVCERACLCMRVFVYACVYVCGWMYVHVCFSYFFFPPASLSNLLPQEASRSETEPRWIASCQKCVLGHILFGPPPPPPLVASSFLLRAPCRWLRPADRISEEFLAERHLSLSLWLWSERERAHTAAVTP